MSETVDHFLNARIPYQDTDNFAIGYGPPPRPTYKGTLADLAAYMAIRAGTGQATVVGNANYNMQLLDSELATGAALSFSPTWTLIPANSVAAGTRRRIVDLAGVIGVHYIAVTPYGSDTINGLTQIVLVQRFSHLVLETNGVNGWVIVERGPNLSLANNLSDLANSGAAINSLGLGTAALHNIIDFMVAVNNLSELIDKVAARNNLELGPLSTLDTLLYSNLDPSAIATPADIASGAPNKLLPANLVSGSRATVALPWAANTNWDFSTFINATYSHTAPPAGITPKITASNIPPGQSGFIIFLNTHTGTYLASNTIWPTQFNFVSATTTLSNTFNVRDMLEYWCETNSLIRCKLTKGV